MKAGYDLRPVVVADDNEDDLFFTCRWLEVAGLGVNISSCRNGKQVIALLSRIKAASSVIPLAVFLDVKMPNMDGFETLKWIRSQKRFAEVGVFMLSGSAEVRDVRRARSLGANDYLVKNPSPEVIAQVVNTLMQ